MTRQWVTTGAAVLFVALLAPTGVAHADPVAPRPNAACPQLPSGTRRLFWSVQIRATLGEQLATNAAATTGNNVSAMCLVLNA